MFSGSIIGCTPLIYIRLLPFSKTVDQKFLRRRIPRRPRPALAWLFSACLLGPKRASRAYLCCVGIYRIDEILLDLKAKKQFAMFASKGRKRFFMFGGSFFRDAPLVSAWPILPSRTVIRKSLLRGYKSESREGFLLWEPFEDLPLDNGKCRYSKTISRISLCCENFFGSWKCKIAWRMALEEENAMIIRSLYRGSGVDISRSDMFNPFLPS
jgi:hypothetical protein